MLYNTIYVDSQLLEKHPNCEIKRRNYLVLFLIDLCKRALIQEDPKARGEK